MSYYMMVVSIDSTTHPDATSIENALNLVTFNSGDGWVGPTSRITRIPTSSSFVGHSWQTTVARLLQLNDLYSDSYVQTVLSNYGTIVRGALAALTNTGDWGVPSFTPYNPTLNGSIDWWQSGQDGTTQSRDAARSLLGQAMSSTENPVGPDTSATTQQVPGVSIDTGTGQSPIQQTTSLLQTVAWVAAGGVALYLLWPVFSKIRSRSAGAEPQLSGGISSRRSSRRYRTTLPYAQDEIMAYDNPRESRISRRFRSTYDPQAAKSIRGIERLESPTQSISAHRARGYGGVGYYMTTRDVGHRYPTGTMVRVRYGKTTGDGRYDERIWRVVSSKGLQAVDGGPEWRQYTTMVKRRLGPSLAILDVMPV